MKSVIIPDNVTKIGQKAFEDTGLTVVIMNPVVKNELELEFGSNQSFYGKDNVVINPNRETLRSRTRTRT